MSYCLFIQTLSCHLPPLTPLTLFQCPYNYENLHLRWKITKFLKRLFTLIIFYTASFPLTMYTHFSPPSQPFRPIKGRPVLHRRPNSVPCEPLLDSPCQVNTWRHYRPANDPLLPAGLYKIIQPHLISVVGNPSKSPTTGSGHKQKQKTTRGASGNEEIQDSFTSTYVSGCSRMKWCKYS